MGGDKVVTAEFEDTAKKRMARGADHTKLALITATDTSQCNHQTTTESIDKRTRERRRRLGYV